MSERIEANPHGKPFDRERLVPTCSEVAKSDVQKQIERLKAEVRNEFLYSWWGQDTTSRHRRSSDGHRLQVSSIDEIVTLTACKKIADYDNLIQQLAAKDKQIEELKAELDACHSNWVDAQKARKRLALQVDDLQAEIKKLKGLLKASHEQVCSNLCRYVWKTKDKPAHCELCRKIEQALINLPETEDK